MRLQSGQYANIDVLTVCRDPARFDGQERLPFFNLLSLFHINLSNCTLLRREDLRSAGSRHQIADHRLLSRILREKQEGDDDRSGYHNEPGYDLGR